VDKPWDSVLPLVTARGRTIWVRAFGEVEREEGQPVRLVGAIQDVTESHLRQVEFLKEQALREQVEQHARELGVLLDERGEMLDVLAHEVRQPLNNASAALQSAAAGLADLGERDTSQRLARAQAVLTHVLASIDNTLAVAALLVRAEPIARSDTDIDTLIAVTIADMPAAERHRVKVERATSTRTASMDMSLVRLALRNLLSNALTCSPPGAPVTIRVSELDDPLALVIEVADQGTGVSADLLPRLFERGARESRSGGRGGSGLGLYIVRKVMELHGGRVELVRNRPDGATMRLVIEESNVD
jgi:signal transduction histidine kinase